MPAAKRDHAASDTVGTASNKDLRNDEIGIPICLVPSHSTEDCCASGVLCKYATLLWLLNSI